MPLVIFGVLEVALRLGGYGYSTGFFQNVRLGGQDYLVNSETFSLRFFPPQLARWPEPIMMPATKAPDTYRIFILGESAAQGVPHPPYSAARYMEKLLRERYPSQKFEIINVAFTAINSHVILPIARELARQQGDLWVIYMGNNEMVGPFGAVTVFGAQAPPLGLVRLGLAVQQLRIGQFLMALARKARGKAATPSSWHGMKMFLGNEVRPDAPRRQVVHRSFERNLQDIVRAGLDSGAKVLLNTVAVNLKDCPPFASPANSKLASADRTAWDKAYHDGCAAAARGNASEAALKFEQAARLDRRVADLQFRWAECLLALTNSSAAREHFQLACDYDALPFRADSLINSLIRQVSARCASSNLDLFDAAAMASNNPDGVSGEDWFYEHVHLNFDSNYRLGRAWAEQVERMLPPSIRKRAVGGWASQEACEHRLGLSDWNRCEAVLNVIERLHHPPFTTQLNNAGRLTRLQTVAAALQRRMTRPASVQARTNFLAAIQRDPDDHWLHEEFACFLESLGDVKQAAAEWQRARALLPHNWLACFQLGRLLAKQGSTAEAENALRYAVAVRPSATEGWFELGNLYLNSGQAALALTAYERASQLQPQEATYYALAGKALAELNRRTEAIEQYRQAIRLDPSLAHVHFALADELAASDQFIAAQQEYEQVVQLMPTNTLGHLNLGVMLARQGRFDPALREFSEVLRLDPTDQQAQEYFDQVKGWKNRKP